MYQQSYEHLNSILSPKQRGVLKGSQHSALSGYAKKIQRTEGQGRSWGFWGFGEFGDFSTDLSEAFDYKDLLVTKLS